MTALRLVTWNVWFGGHRFDERREALFAELRRRAPDVIALQEVTPELLAPLVDEPWTEAYELSDRDGHTMWHYGVLLLARSPIRRLRVVDLPSQMGRRLLIAELAGGLTVATVHLESTSECGPERVKQLGMIAGALAGYDDVVLVGDMNFTPADAGETAALDPRFTDVWPALRGDDPGYTVDTDRNLMRYQVQPRPTHKRIDRVFLASRRWRAQAIELVGTAPIDGDGTFVSDHFGLAAELGSA